MNEGTLFAVVCYWEDEEINFNRYVKLFRQKADALRYSCSCNEDWIFNVEPISYEVAKVGNILDLLED